METGTDVFTDVMDHIQAVNLPLQGRDKIVSDLNQRIFSFQVKIYIFQRDIDTKSLQHFPLLKEHVNSENYLCSEKTKIVR